MDNLKVFRTFRATFDKYKVPAILAGFLTLGVMSAVVSPSSVSEARADEIPDVSTFIPRGHLLIPIEVRNADQLDGVLGAHGVVDLFETPDDPSRPSRMVGRRLRMIRAPLNPKAFAVLVKDSEADRFLSFRGPLMASLRSLESDTHEVRAQARKSRIEFQMEER